ncbi:helix-turn-helix domain-containing protein [Streptomyces sp. Wh19]|uniref:helix-turn-helix domain-containing protein n=1 Tax=Streptomyces sp. Wh19 TaxID=3076629 RepID=UPI0029588935|nr:helix-turn-helix transcriptional regulator [Streptomyces sp. Wh19]MDV9194355.1 helix-turn-helix transcriptional regulator [Streptomyces sp. Wh19]
MATHAPLYKLVKPGLLRTLMERTGTGAAVSVRELSALTGVPRSTIGALLTGAQQAVQDTAAHAIVEGLGVDLLILFAPVGRSVTLTAVPETESA